VDRGTSTADYIMEIRARRCPRKLKVDPRVWVQNYSGWTNPGGATFSVGRRRSRGILRQVCVFERLPFGQPGWTITLSECRKPREEIAGMPGKLFARDAQHDFASNSFDLV